jgi:Fe-S cluster biogenesis protein NfuA
MREKVEMTLKMGVERMLKQQVPEVKSVETA